MDEGSISFVSETSQTKQYKRRDFGGKKVRQRRLVSCFEKEYDYDLTFSILYQIFDKSKK